MSLSSWRACSRNCTGLTTRPDQLGDVILDALLPTPTLARLTGREVRHKRVMALYEGLQRVERSVLERNRMPQERQPLIVRQTRREPDNAFQQMRVLDDQVFRRADGKPREFGRVRDVAHREL